MSLKDLTNGTRPGPGFAAAPTPMALTMDSGWINQAIVRMSMVARLRLIPA